VLRHTLVPVVSAFIAVGLVAPASVIAAPTARYTYSPANPVAGQMMMFDGASSSCDRKPCSYRWRDDGPDGPRGANIALGTGMTLSHTFLQAGAKYVRLTVTNRRGRSNSIVKTIYVAAPAPPPAPACSNQLDDDGDGLVDAADPGCVDAQDIDEWNLGSPPQPAPACSDSQDNDADGRTDHPADTGCDSPQDGTESPDPQPPADIDRALNQNATASSHEQPPLYEPRFANDGDPTTRWSSDYADGQWWQVDLGSYYAVERVELNWEAAYASSYRIQASDDGLVFTTVASPTISAAGDHAHSFAPTRARYVRLLGVTRATPWGISLFDAEVYGQPTDPPPPPPSPPPPSKCANQLDDDGDGQVDLADPGCTDAQDNDETNPAEPPPPNAPTLQQVDGGTGWYGQFSNPFSTGPGFFPLGVWFESVTEQHDVNLDKDVGLNTYVVLTGNSNIPLVNSNGMRALLQTDEPRFRPSGPETAGWVLSDEIDMTSATCADLRAQHAAKPPDGRLGYANYGKGVAFWRSDSEAACLVNGTDLVSDDIYWFTDPNVCWSSSEGPAFYRKPAPLPLSECRRASNYGDLVDKMRRLDNMDGQRKPIWAFVEVGHPFGNHQNSRTIAPAEVRAAVWHSLIAGARGISYFNHNFGGSCISQHVLRDVCGAAVRPTVRDVNAQIKQLAPVLNAPSVTSGHSASSNLKTLVKWQNGRFHVFAGSALGSNQGPHTGTVSIPCVGNATATVVGESRTVPVVGGSFSDQFVDGNAVHIYRIDGGATCGLPNN
jgi:F5/8 type C domain/PKD domain